MTTTPAFDRFPDTFDAAGTPARRCDDAVADRVVVFPWLLLGVVGDEQVDRVEYGWHRKARNGRILSSGGGYDDLRGAVRGALRACPDLPYWSFHVDEP